MPRSHIVGCRKSIRTQRGPSRTGYDQPPSMLLFVLYACLRLLIDLALAPLRDRAADQAELLVLRHQVRLLERQMKDVRWRQGDPPVPLHPARRLIHCLATCADEATKPVPALNPAGDYLDQV